MYLAHCIQTPIIAFKFTFHNDKLPFVSNIKYLMTLDVLFFYVIPIYSSFLFDTKLHVYGIQLVCKN